MDLDLAASARRLAASTKRFLRRRPRLAAGILLPALVLLSVPLWGGLVVGPMVTSRLSARLGVPVALGGSHVGFGVYRMKGLTVGEDGGPGGRVPLAVIDSVEAPLGAVFGRGVVVVRGARFEIERGGPRDNVSAVLDRLRGRQRPRPEESEGGAARGRSLPAVALEGCALVARDVNGGRTLSVERLDARLVPGESVSVKAARITGRVRLRGGDRDPTFGAASLEIDGALEGLRPLGYPAVRVRDGYVQVLRAFGLTGIKGEATPARAPGAGRPQLSLELSGSYGGARETLWTAHGTLGLVPGGGGAGAPAGGLEGTLALRAARFSLEKIADILPPSVLEPRATTIDGALNLVFAPGAVGFNGNLAVKGLSLHHDAVASEPVMGIDTSLRLDGSIELPRRRLQLRLLEGKIGAAVGRLFGSVELAPGTFKFKDGSEMAMLPKIDLAFQVPRIRCDRLLASIPAAVIPHLAGFTLQGNFEANVRARIDYADLEALDLGGKVGIDGCKVVKPSEEVAALVSGKPLKHTVEVPLAPPGQAGVTELVSFVLGPENPDFVPITGISPHLINAIMTTEDNGFFRHRGWVSSQFETALERNLANGGFRLGASSITMQMVKNVLLSREKTLSRKLQELFLVWHLEQVIPKERILELYFNAIEFGPRLYGIGPATRHYFAKTPAELTPIEAAFFSSILPSPKRRYVQYCHGAPQPAWDKYVRKILARMYERGRLGDEEYADAAAETLTFDVTSRPGDTKACLEWVKTITQRPVDVAPEPEAL